MTVQPMPETEAQLLVIAENLLSRAGLSALLEDRGCIVLAQVDGVDLQRDIDRLAPDLLVVDLGWDGAIIRQRLIQIDRDLPVLVLVATDDNEALSPLLQELRLFPAIRPAPARQRTRYSCGSSRCA